jgi:hypothetical protein
MLFLLLVLLVLPAAAVRALSSVCWLLLLLSTSDVECLLSAVRALASWCVYRRARAAARVCSSPNTAVNNLFSAVNASSTRSVATRWVMYSAAFSA